MRDPLFVIEHNGDPYYALVTRSSDGQMLFLANKLSKMKEDTPLGSRIAEVHNRSSLFTRDAGHGESNIRRWIIENDWLEAIVALPLNLICNTGIATYVWVLSNKKPEQRKGKVQLIDATQWYRPLRKNLGKKAANSGSRMFPREEFDYWKVTVDRPLRLAVDLPEDKLRQLRVDCESVGEESLAQLVDRVAGQIGAESDFDFNAFLEEIKRDPQ